MMNRIGVGALSVLFSVIGVGCGGHKSSSTATTTVNPTIRIANATKTSTLTMNGVGVTDTTIAFTSTAVSPSVVSEYKTASVQTFTVGVGAANGTLTASTQSIGLSANTNYTLLAFERSGAINTYTLVDNQVTPSTGFASVLVANAGGDAGPLDVYLVSPNAALNGVAPVFTGIASKSTAAAKAITEGTYDIVVTANGKVSDVRLTIPGVQFVSTDIVTIALTSTPGGSLVDGAIYKQAGSLQLVPSTLARVRLVGAFPPNTSTNPATNSIVTASVAGTSLGTLTAPSVGTYKLVSGGSSTYTVSVDGVAVATVPSVTFAVGGDYTIMVAGTAASPSVSILTDNNQPSVSGNANIRLVNAAVQGSITLTDNFVPIDSDVGYNTASDYGPASPLSTSVLQLTSPVASFNPPPLNNVNIAASSVYTMFVLGSASSPVVSLSKDR